MKKFLNKIDTRLAGIIVGVILPILTFFVFAHFKYDNYTLKQVFNFISANSNNRFEPLTYSLIPSFVLFYFTNYQLRIDKFTVGLVLSTMILSILVVLSLLF